MERNRGLVGRVEFTMLAAHNRSMRGYIKHWESVKTNPTLIIYLRPILKSRRLGNDKRIVIPSAKGGTYICNDFRIEKRSSDGFVIFCDAPFISK